MEFLMVKNKVVKPQDTIATIQGIFTGIDLTGFDRKFDFKEFEGKYLVIFFLPLDSKTDFEDLAQLMKEKEKFEELDCQMVGVTSCNPFALKMIIDKQLGGAVRFPLFCDKDLSLSMMFGVALRCGTPAKGTIILDKTGQVRFTQTQNSDVERNVGEIVRLVTAYQFSDDNEAALKAGWTPNSEFGIIPCDSEGKEKYYQEVYAGHVGSQAIVKEEARDKIKKEDDRIICTRLSIGLIVAVVYAVVGLSFKACKIISSGNDE